MFSGDYRYTNYKILINTDIRDNMGYKAYTVNKENVG